MNSARVIMRNFSVLLLGNVVTRVLSIVYIAALARYIGADGIGQLSTATALVSILILLVNFGFDPLITREVAANTQTAPDYLGNLLFLRAVLTLIFCAVLAIIVMVVPYDTDLRLIILIYALVYIVDNFSGLARAIFQAFQHMEYEVAVDVLRTVINVGLSLIGIHLGWSLALIVFASAVASLLKLVLSFVLIRWRFVQSAPRIDMRMCWQVLFAAVPFFLLMAANVVQGQVNVLALSLLDNSTAVGWFSAGMYPITMLFIVPTLFMDSIYPAFARDFRHNPRSLARTYHSAFKFMCVIGFPLGIGLMVVSRPVIHLLYGANFEPAAPILVLMAVQLVTAVGYVNGALLNAAGRQSLFMKLRIVALLFNLILCGLLIPPLSYFGAALACIIPVTVDFFFYTILCHRLVAQAPEWVNAALKPMAATAIMAAVCALALNTGVNVFAVALLGSALYIGLLFVFNIIDAGEWLFIRELAPVRKLLRVVSAHAARRT